MGKAKAAVVAFALVEATAGMVEAAAEVDMLIAAVASVADMELANEQFALVAEVAVVALVLGL